MGYMMVEWLCPVCGSKMLIDPITLLLKCPQCGFDSNTPSLHVLLVGMT